MQFGGDGTINRILNCIIYTKNHLGIIPVGTGNDFYKVLNQSNDLFTKIDVGKINHKYFINVVCFGIDADVGNNVKVLKSKIIPLNQRYNASVLYTFFKYKNKELEFIFNEKKQNGKFTTIAVCNGRYYGSGYNIAPTSVYNDGLFDIYYVKNLKKFFLPRLIMKMKNGKHENSKYINKIQTNEVIIKSQKDIVCNMDGEEMVDNTFSIKIIPNAISIYNNQELTKKIL